jgi:hypothetical protein
MGGGGGGSPSPGGSWYTGEIERRFTSLNNEMGRGATTRLQESPRPARYYQVKGRGLLENPSLAR